MFILFLIMFKNEECVYLVLRYGNGNRVEKICNLSFPSKISYHVGLKGSKHYQHKEKYYIFRKYVLEQFQIINNSSVSGMTCVIYVLWTVILFSR